MIAVLGMVMFAGAKALQADSQYTRMMRGRIFAKRYAEMGIEVARHPVMREDDPLLHFSSNDGGGYNVKLVAEEARLNANHLIQTGIRIVRMAHLNDFDFINLVQAVQSPYMAAP